MARKYATAKRTRSDENSYFTRKIQQLFKKLESNPRYLHEETVDEEDLRFAKVLLRAAINRVHEKIAKSNGTACMLPKNFCLYGRRYSLRYSNLGRVFIETKSGLRVIASDFDVI